MKYIFLLTILMVTELCLAQDSPITSYPRSISLSTGVRIGSINFMATNDELNTRDLTKIALNLKYNEPLWNNISLFSIVSYENSKKNLTFNSTATIDNKKVEKKMETEFKTNMIFAVIGPELRAGKKYQIYLNFGYGVAYHYNNKHLSGYVKTKGTDGDFTRISLPPDQLPNTTSSMLVYSLGFARQYAKVNIFVDFIQYRTGKMKNYKDFETRYNLGSLNWGVTFNLS